MIGARNGHKSAAPGPSRSADAWSDPGRLRGLLAHADPIAEVDAALRRNRHRPGDAASVDLLVLGAFRQHLPVAGDVLDDADEGRPAPRVADGDLIGRLEDASLRIDP